jgi:putative ABC transport system permease protein
MKKYPSPPKLFLRFFRWYCHPKLKDSIEGDLLELYHERIKVHGKTKANINFTLDVILLFRPGIIGSANQFENFNHATMFKNYFKIGIRNILKYKTFSFINVFGLAVAMSVCMLIILMLADQNRFDQFHEKKDRVHRILSDYENSRQSYATTPYPLAASLKTEYPIVEDATNLTPGVGGDALYQQKIVEMRGYFADPSFFNVFSFDLVQGDQRTCLASPNSMVISNEIASRLFKDENPIGKTVDFSDRQLPFPQGHDGVGSTPVPWGSFTITGIIDETKYKSHLRFDVLVSSSSMQALYAEKKVEDMTNNWEWFYRTYTYALIDPNKSSIELDSALNDLVAHKYKTIKSEQTKGFKLQSQKLSDVQLGLMGNDTNNRLPLVGYYFLAILALVIMTTACLNYTNLAVARALSRAKEIGVRKVTGANRKSLIFQFLTESIVTSLLSLTLAILLLLLIKPAFMNLWVNKHLNFELPSSLSVYLTFFGFALVIGIIAGIYPAFHLSAFQPIKALKHLDSMKPGKLGMRKILSASQFVISLFFITTSILVFNQFKHFMEFDYGFSSKNIVNVELQGSDYKKLATQFRDVAGVSSISACDIIPAAGGNNNTQLKKVGSTEEFTTAGLLMTDENFTENLGLKIIAGKNLPESYESSDRFILVNESAVKTLGYRFPAQIIGETFESKWGNEILEVVGVVEDFRYKLLINEDKIAPLILRNQPANFQYLNVRISSADLKSTIVDLEAKWTKIDPIHPFKYEFFDEQLATTHQGVFDLVSILGFIAFLAIVIACLGLLGMAIYTSERKRKEVGIRKVLGAESLSIALLLSKEFVKTLTISICIGAPLSYLSNNFWLQYLPNRVEFGLETVSIGASVLLILGLITIGSQTIRASRSNPVESLRAE